jgi:hypothetical protein
MRARLQRKQPSICLIAEASCRKVLFIYRYTVFKLPKSEFRIYESKKQEV